MKSVAIVDDHSILLRPIANYIEANSDFKVVGTFTGGNDLLEATENGLNYDYLVLDLFMDEGDGFIVMDELKQKNVKIVVLTFNKEVGLIEQILRNGVSAVVNKASEENEIINALHSVSKNKSYTCPIIQESIENKRKSVYDLNQAEALTNREREILKLICIKELTNAEIGDELNISEKTVKTHRKNIYRKMEVGSSIQLIRKAIMLGYITV